MQRFSNACWIAMATVSVLAAADATYLGKWKLNPAKSQLTGETVSIEQTPSGGMRYVSAESRYEFKPDGKEYPTPRGGTTAWKEVSPNVWEVMMRRNGEVTVTYRDVVKGDTWTTTAHVKKPDGGTMEETSTFTRVSGGPGLLGEWKSTKVNAPASGLELASNGVDGLTINVPEYGIGCTAKLDGKDYPMTGPRARSKETLSFKKTGPNSFEMTEKLEGKPIYVDTFTVSADGKTLTDDGTPTSRKELTKVVYDRQ
jgi:hypothetical protein